jgi:hypothetical protein
MESWYLCNTVNIPSHETLVVFHRHRLREDPSEFYHSHIKSFGLAFKGFAGVAGARFFSQTNASEVPCIVRFEHEKPRWLSLYDINWMKRSRFGPWLSQKSTAPKSKRQKCSQRRSESHWVRYASFVPPCSYFAGRAQGKDCSWGCHLYCKPN